MIGCHSDRPHLTVEADLKLSLFRISPFLIVFSVSRITNKTGVYVRLTNTEIYCNKIRIFLLDNQLKKKNRANTGKGRKNENSPSPQKEVKHLKGSHRHGVTQFEQMFNEKKSKISIY